METRVKTYDAQPRLTLKLAFSCLPLTLVFGWIVTIVNLIYE